MSRPTTPAERRAMADALRHMHAAGVRRIDIRQASQLTSAKVHQAITHVILSGRDGIGSLTGVVSPRQPVPLRGGLPVDLAGDSGAVPALFQGGPVDGDRVGEP